MASFDSAYFNIGYLDRLSYGDSAIHRLDSRAKVIATLAFILSVVSCRKYDIATLLPFFAFPVIIGALSDTPFVFIFKRVAAVSPFAVLVGVFNPVFDRDMVFIGGVAAISAGWISFLSIILKFALTISSTLLLLATTSFPEVCSALGRLGLPNAFTSQLLFLYRYMFVMMEEAMRMVRARDLRSFGGRGTEPRIYVRLVGILFIRTVERAERIYNAMLCRGFNGNIVSMRRGRIGAAEVLFMLFSAGLFAVLRLTDVSGLIGRGLGL